MARRELDEKVERREAIERVDELLDGDLYQMTEEDWSPFLNARGKPDERFMVDHVRINKEGEVTQHPYAMGMEQARQLIAWCDEHGYEFYITGASEYYPAATFQMVFKKTGQPSGKVVEHVPRTEGKKAKGCKITEPVYEEELD